MAQFKWLWDIERILLDKLDQYLEDPGETWTLRERSRAFNAVHKRMHSRLTTLDKNFGMVESDAITAASGDTFTSLPTDIHSLRAAYVLDGSGEIERWLEVGEWHELGEAPGCASEALYQPYPTPRLRWMRKLDAATPLKLIYYQTPPELLHTCVVSGGATTVEIESWNSTQDDIFNGLAVRVPTGAGAGQETTLTDSNGADHTVTAASWSPQLDETSFLTSRPSLPLAAENAYIYGCLVWLTDKLQDERFDEFKIEYLDLMRELETDISTREMRSPDRLIDDYPYGHGDPRWNI